MCVCVCVDRDGGVCYRSCDGRVTITNVSSYGAVGSRRAPDAAAAQPCHVYCLFTLTVFDSLDDVSANDDIPTPITLTVPANNLNTTCLKVSEILSL